MNELENLSLKEKILKQILAFGMMLLLSQGYLFALPGTQQNITGRVIDNSGDPIPGVTVVIKGTTQGTITDQDGQFTLPAASGDDILVFSFIGMKTLEETVGNRTRLEVVMEEDLV